MKAALLATPGTPVYADVPEPDTTDPVIDVTLAAINPFDVHIAKVRKDTPVVPGFEGVGRYQGRRVYFQSFMGRHGAMGQKASAKPDKIFDIPDGISDTMAIVLGTTGLTAYLSLVDGGNLQKGETVLVLGASGIVGRIAVQIAKHMGAGRIVAAARNLDALSDLPADATVSLANAIDPEVLAQTFREAGQPNLVIDTLWGVPGLAALKALEMGGRQLQIGHSAGTVVEFFPQFMRLRNTHLIGYSSGLAAPARTAEAYATLAGLAKDGVIKAPTQVFPLSKIGDAWAAQLASPNKKLCIDVSA